MNKSTIIGIILLILVILTWIIIPFIDYNKAKNLCNHLKSENNCNYQICMAKEYSSRNMMDKVIICKLIKDASRELDEVKE